MLILLTFYSCLHSDSKSDRNYEIRVFNAYSLKSYKLVINNGKLGCDNLPNGNRVFYPSKVNENITKELEELLNSFDYDKEPINNERAGLNIESEKIILHIIVKQYNRNNKHYEYMFFEDFSGYSKEFKELFNLIEDACETCEKTTKNKSEFEK
ncbi:hypothetical protein WJN01_10135 [Flavobacteriaceae bacterium SZ-1-7]